MNCQRAGVKDIDEARTKMIICRSWRRTWMLFCGFLLPEKKMPWYFAWLYHTSFWQYCISILQINELEGKVYTEDCPVAQLEQVFGECSADSPELSAFQGFFQEMLDQVLVGCPEIMTVPCQSAPAPPIYAY